MNAAVARMEIIARGICAIGSPAFAHMGTAAAYVMIGGLMLWGAVAFWNMDDHGRAELLGPYVTDAGWRLVVSHWWFVFMFGAFIASCAVDHAADWLAANGLLLDVLTDPVRAMIGRVEEVVAGVTAVGVAFIARRVVRAVSASRRAPTWAR